MGSSAGRESRGARRAMGELAEHQGDGARAPEEELRPPRKHERSDRAGALASRGTRAARERGVAGRAQGSLAGRGELQDARHGHRTGGRATMEMGIDDGAEPGCGRAAARLSATREKQRE
jgi:hypothetical protein